MTSTQSLDEVEAHRPDTGSGWLPLAVAGISLLFGIFGTCWAFGWWEYPLGASGETMPSLLSHLPNDLSAGLLAVLGWLGIPAALAFRRYDWSPSAFRPLLVFAAVEALVFGLLATDLSVVVITGYLLAVFGIPAAAVFLLIGAWRQRTLRLLAVVAAVFVVVAQLTVGLFDWAAFRQLGEGMATVPDKLGTRPLYVFGAFLLGVAWAILTIQGSRAARHRCLACGRPGARWTRPEVARRWGFWATIVAVLCPMPYALLRMTWLLPNPIGFSAEELDADPGIRLFGLGLGLVALAAGLVTLGLIRPWGEIWPRWMPVLAGRPVPIKAAVIPGAVATVLLLVASPSLIEMTWSQGGSSWDNLKWFLLFPFPVWGASVGLATAAYYYRRRTPCPTCHQP
ncbi:hypothetical protein [Kribbella deserti]|uniref:Uncharacterized protein n=1 Tax=Kribbella deserti TaxID=1926257 RepID=A0ABV6QT93_9ACTN